MVASRHRADLELAHGVAHTVGHGAVGFLVGEVMHGLDPFIEIYH